LEIDIILDKFTPCLENIETGELISTSYSKAGHGELKGLKRQGWNFNWTSKSLKNCEVYKLTIENDRNIQGLIAIEDIKRDKAVYIRIVESAPHNFGKNKRYNGVGGHLFAIAAKRSTELGYDGFLYMDAKNIDLVRHYQKILGAKFLGMYHDYRMYVDEEAVQKLLKKYTLLEE